jgi:signal transduction histidine kinase
VLINLSQAYLSKGEEKQAMEYLNHSLELARQAGLKDSQAHALAKMARLYLKQEAYQQAQECGQQAKKLYRDAGNGGGEAEAQIVLGDVFMAQKFEDRAVDCYQAGLAIAQKGDFHNLTVEALLKLGKVHLNRGEASQALPFLEQACALADESGQKKALCESHQALAMAYRQLKDFEKALTHFEQFYAIKEELMVQELQNSQKNQEMLFQAENARKEAEIHQLKSVILQEEIHQRQEMEKALTQAKEKLMREVASREQLIDDLNAFSFMVAHDLKNPLTNIALTAGVLRMSVTLANDKVGQEAADRLYHQVEKINRIINELLVLASVQKEAIETEPLDMEAIITEVELRLERLIKEHRPEIRKPASWPVACGHAPWVEEVWENYLSNAIHYGGRPPIIEIGADQEKDGMIRFWVRDNGRGLSE